MEPSAGNARVSPRRGGATPTQVNGYDPVRQRKMRLKRAAVARAVRQHMTASTWRQSREMPANALVEAIEARFHRPQILDRSRIMSYVETVDGCLTHDAHDPYVGTTMKKNKQSKHVKKISVRQSDLAEVTGGAAECGPECGSECATECGTECGTECASESAAECGGAVPR